MHKSALTSIRFINMTWPFIWSAALTITFGAIISRWQGQPFFPAVDKERASPMLLLMTCFLLFALLPFTVTLELFQQHLRCDTSTWRRWTFSFIQWTFSFDLIGRYLRFRINSSIFLGRWWHQNLGWGEPSSLVTSTMFVAKGCPSIFIVYLGASNFNLLWSKAI